MCYTPHPIPAYLRHPLPVRKLYFTLTATLEEIYIYRLYIRRELQFSPYFNMSIVVKYGGIFEKLGGGNSEPSEVRSLIDFVAMICNITVVNIHLNYT